MLVVEKFRALLLCALLAFGGCGGRSQPGEVPGQAEAASDTSATGKGGDVPGQPVTPPFAVQGELDGLLLVWFDAEGAHSAARRSEIPEAQRKTVRVDSLNVAPGARLDPEQVYVADVSQPAANGRYTVWQRPRAWFDAQVEAARGKVPAPSAAPAAVAGASSDVTLYSASWCGACKAAASYMRSHDIPFAEKDIEKDAAANAEMQSKARAAGKTPRGVPVIDFRGHILLGFSAQAIDQLLAQTAKP